MKDYAELLECIVQYFKYEKINIVAHSMGGVIAILLAIMHPQLINQLILAEAIINPQNAKISRDIVAYGNEQKFSENYDRFIERFNKPNKKISYQYYLTLLRCPSFVVFRSAKSLLSTIKPPFYEKFLHLPMPRFYLLGSKSYYTLSIEEKEEFLKNNIPIYEVSNAGHSMMIENPDAFYSKVAKIMQV